MKKISRSSDPVVKIGRADEGADLAVWRAFVTLAAAGEAVALVTVIGDAGSSPRGMGAVMAVRGDGSIVGTIGGGSLEQLIIGHAHDALADGCARRVFYDYSGGRGQNLEKACMGKTEFLIQPRPAVPELLIFGGGHIAAALAPMAELAGYSVTVLDDREGFPRAENFSPTVRRVHGPFPARIAELHVDAQRTFAVIVTYGHTQDEAVLRELLPLPMRYIGMIGSRAKTAHVFNRVADSESARERLARVHAPIGLDLGGRAPGEIAVAILAELQAVRHARAEIQHMRDRYPTRIRPSDVPAATTEQMKVGP